MGWGSSPTPVSVAHYEGKIHMKHISTVLIALLFLAGVSTAMAAPFTAVCTIEHTGVQGSHAYQFEMWGQALPPPDALPGDSLVVRTSIFRFTFDHTVIIPDGFQLSQRYVASNNGYGANLVTTGDTATVTLTYTQPSDISILPNNLSEAPGGEFIFLVHFYAPTLSGNPKIAWLTAGSGFATVQNFLLGGDSSPLPIQLASFMVQKANAGSMQLTWTTLSEIKNYGFYVQKSLDKQSWENVGDLIPSHGTTAATHTYNVTLPISKGSWWIRLVQQDLDGTRTAYDAQLLQMASPAKFALNQNYPNPFNPSAQILFSVAKEGPVSLRVYDILGREVATLVNENRKPGEYTERFDGTRFASGVYLYVLRSSEGQLVGRMMLSK